MATDYGSFTKRAAAELSRCFNGLNVNKNSASSAKKTTSTNGSATSNQTSSFLNNQQNNETIIKNNNNNSTNKTDNNIIKSINNTTNNINTTSTSTSSNLFTLTNSVKSIGSAYEQNILAAKTALRSPFKSISNEKSPNKSIVSNVVNSFNGFNNQNNENIQLSSNELSTNKLQQHQQSNQQNQILNCPSPLTPRKQAPKAPPKTNRARLRNYLLSLRLSKPKSVDELWLDDKFLKQLFKYFSPIEICKLAQVNNKWRDILYEDKDNWTDLMPIIYFNELRREDSDNKSDQKFYDSLEKRQFKELCIYAANDNDIMDFCMKTNSLTLLNRLESLSFRNCNITDKGLEFLLATVNQQLSKLEICSCNDISDSGLWTGLVANLKSLTIMDCINISDETMATVAMLPLLKEFNLQAYHVTDTGFSFFSIPENGKQSSKVQIEVLNLISCWEITNQALNHIAIAMPKIRHLSLSGCSKISDDAVETISEQLINLRHLDLSWCSHITSVSLEYLACDLADQLKTLILDRCIHITDQGLNYIASMTSLEDLSLRWCPQIRDIGIQTICNMKSLKRLSIAGCSLSAQGITCLVRLPQLEELELTNCNVSDDLIAYLKCHLSEKCEIIYN